MKSRVTTDPEHRNGDGLDSGTGTGTGGTTKTGYSFPVMEVDIPMPMVKPPKSGPYASMPDAEEPGKGKTSVGRTGRPTPA